MEMDSSRCLRLKKQLKRLMVKKWACNRGNGSEQRKMSRCHCGHFIAIS